MCHNTALVVVKVAVRCPSGASRTNILRRPCGNTAAAVAVIVTVVIAVIVTRSSIITMASCIISAIPVRPPVRRAIVIRAEPSAAISVTIAIIKSYVYKAEVISQIDVPSVPGIVEESKTPRDGPCKINGAVPRMIMITGTIDNSGTVVITAQISSRVARINIVGTYIIDVHIFCVVCPVAGGDVVNVAWTIVGHGPRTVGIIADEPHAIVERKVIA